MIRNQLFLIIIFFAWCFYFTCSTENLDNSYENNAETEDQNKGAKLPDYQLDSILVPGVFENTHELFLGYEKDSTSRKMVMHFDSLKTISFTTLEEEIRKISTDKTIDELRSVVFKLKVEKEIPYHVVRYVELMLMKYNLLNISYLNRYGQELNTRLPPFPDNDCKMMYPAIDPKSCFDWKLIAEEEFNYMGSMGLAPTWMPVAKRNETKIREENLFHIEIYPPDDLITINDSPAAADSIPALALEHITLQHPAKAIFLIETDGMANFGTFFKVLARLLEMYRNKKQEVAQERHNLAFEALNREQQIRIRSDFPEVISVQKK